MHLQYTLLQQYLSESARLMPGKTAVIYQGQSYTYAQINDLADNMAKFLVAHGIKRGDRVVVKLGNSVEAVIAFWAILKADAIVSLIGSETKLDKILYIIRDAGAVAFINDSWSHDLASALEHECPNLQFVVSAAELKMPNASQRCNYYQWRDALNNAISSQQLTAKNLSLDIASIIYTSGSTGEPKGVVMSHRNMLVASNSLNSYLGNSSAEVIICALPLSFDYGLYQMIMAFAVGATLVLEKDFLWPQLFFKSLNKYQVTALPCVPSMVTLLGDYAKRNTYDLSCVRYITNTGAALLQNHIAILQALFPQAVIFSMYGLTECKRCTYLPPQDINRKPNSVGVAIPNTELWLVDDLGNKLGPGKVGQLVIRGETVMQGYWNKPEATAAKINAASLPYERVLYTGDYCELDEEGYLYFRGRMDEVIKSRGIKVSPKEVEDVISNIPGIKEVAVIGVTHEKYGQEICAVISLQVASTLTVEEIAKACKDKLETAQVPTKILIQANLPKNSNGKIDRLVLQEVYAANLECVC